MSDRQRERIYRVFVGVAALLYLVRRLRLRYYSWRAEQEIIKSMKATHDDR